MLRAETLLGVILSVCFSKKHKKDKKRKHDEDDGPSAKSSKTLAKAIDEDTKKHG